MKLELSHGNWVSLKDAEDVTVDESETLQAVAAWSQADPTRAATALRMYAAEVIEAWSYGVEVPVLVVGPGGPHLDGGESFGKMPVLGFNQILKYALDTVNRISLDFSPSPDPASPTSPSID